MNLFYAPDFPKISELPAGEAKHAIKVLRNQPGDVIRLTNGRGFFYDCEIVSTEGKTCVVRSIHEISAPVPCQSHLHLAIAPVKNFKRFEWLLEKVTELGVNEITPVITHHSERRSMKQERAEKVLISAMKQSLKGYLPRLNPEIRLKDFMENPLQYQEKFIAHLSGESRPIGQLHQRYRSTLILIGPEGDFSENEVNIATGKGFVPITLGRHRLRTETAGVAACAAFHTINDMT